MYVRKEQLPVLSDVSAVWWECKKEAEIVACQAQHNQENILV